MFPKSQNQDILLVLQIFKLEFNGSFENQEQANAGSDVMPYLWMNQHQFCIPSYFHLILPR
jgi:hypothetical protein